MAWRYHGRARVNANGPQAFAVCDRCSLWYNRTNLHFQYDWRGPRIENLYILVCDECYDKPQEQFRPIVLPPDPVPIFNPRPENFTQDYTGISAQQAAQPPDFDDVPED